MADWYPAANKTFIGNDAGTFSPSYWKKGVLHKTEGSSAAGAISAYKKNNSWPHFTVEIDGKVYQHISVQRSARALKNQAGGVETNRGGAIQIEIVGFSANPTLPDAQTQAMRDLMRWIEAQTGVKPEGPGRPFASRYGEPGLRFSNNEWIVFKAWCGHCHVPENDHWDPGFLNLATLLPTIAEVIVKVPNAVAAHHRPGFGREQFSIMSKDGAMYAFNGSEYIDAYNAHPELGGAVREFINFEWDDDGWGYTQYANDGAFYYWRKAGH